MGSTRRSFAWLLILIGAVVFAAGAVWVTQFVFKPAPGGDDGLWTVVGIFIAIVGLLFASMGSMLRRRQI
jgi:vacuolar-type H+-ATPase subunit I/STV1